VTLFQKSYLFPLEKKKYKKNILGRQSLSLQKVRAREEVPHHKNYFPSFFFFIAD